MPATKKSTPAKSASAKKTESKTAKASSTKSKAQDHKSHTTTDREEIRQWVEKNGGWPATVRSTEKGGDPGLLRIEFSDASPGSLEAIEWDEFFEKFDEKGLAFLYQPSSRFNKLVARETAVTKSRGKTKSAGSK